MANPVAASYTASREMARTIVSSRGLLASITRVELQKKYAGSVLGVGWIVLQPALLLAVYLFIYMVVFKVRFPGLGQYDYVLFVFCGLVPYLGFMEALTTAGLSLKQNMHLVKNVMLPIELIPVRTVLVGMASQIVSLAILVVMVAAKGSLTWHIAWLPLVVLLQIASLAGLAWILASVTVALPDTTYVVNLLIFLLMWLSPIGYTPEMVPAQFRFVVALNPVTYMIRAYRDSLLASGVPDWHGLAIFAAGSILAFALGAGFFRAFKGVLVDYE